MPEATSLHCDLLVFDLDGTLVDSEQDLANSVNATLTFLGRSPLPQHQIATFVGDGAAMLLQRALEATGSADEAKLSEALSFFLAYYREHKLDFTRCYPGVVQALKQIRALAPHLPMAVLTNKPQRPAQAICDGLGLSEFFFANHGGDTFTNKKPNPEGMNALMRQASSLGHAVEASRTVLIGDSHVDVETARNAGTKSIGCLYGLLPEKLKTAAPDAFVHHPSEWLAALHAILPRL